MVFTLAGAPVKVKRHGPNQSVPSGAYSANSADNARRHPQQAGTDVADQPARQAAEQARIEPHYKEILAEHPNDG